MWPLYSRFSIFFTVDAGCFARSRFQPSHPEFANQLWGLIAAMDEGLGPIRGWNVDSCSWWRHWWWQGARGGWSLGFLAEMIWKLVYYIKDGHQYRQPFSATRNHRLINMSLWLFVSISVWTTLSVWSVENPMPLVRKQVLNGPRMNFFNAGRRGSHRSGWSCSTSVEVDWNFSCKRFDRNHCLWWVVSYG